MFQASYTFSKAIDQGASFENELNPINFNATRGISLLSAKNRFVFSPVWDLPIPKYEGRERESCERLAGICHHHLSERFSQYERRITNDSELMSSFYFRGCQHATGTDRFNFRIPRTNNAYLV